MAMMRLGKTVLSTEVDGETILLDPESGRYYGLNPMASRMLALLLETADRESILQTLASEYDTTEERLRSDLTSLIADLESKGLIFNAP